MRVAVLGMGQMGRAFAARAVDRGHQVTVWNRSPGRATEVLALGAAEAESRATAVAGADAVLVVLADDAAVLDVCLGADGALAALGPAAVLANVSTVSPDTVRRLADTGPEGRVLDAPVMGSPERIAGGHGAFLIGGPLPVITAMDPLWNDLGAGYTHCGPVGAAATLKLVSNLLLITGVAALAEGIATARRHALSDDLIRQVLADSAVVSVASKVRLPNLMDAAHPGWFTPGLARKDLHLAIDLAQQAGIEVRIGPATEALLTTVIEAGGDWPDFSAVIEAFD
jgi:3-hydroxyisobutyrate dehydrogenase-like beta-hydroxyacid dehydrogenase